LARAVEARRQHGLDTVDIEVVGAPDAFLAGQESAVVGALNGRGAAPSFTGLQPIRHRGVGGRPTLVQNVETLAHVALIARFGPDWFRAVGTDQFPGTMLLTVTGRHKTPMVLEAPLGTPLREVLELSPDDAVGRYAGALLGGYGGGWVSMRSLLDLDLTETSARQLGTSLGAGVVVLLPRSACPLAEVARVVRYMEGQGAGQCGPCVNGLSALAAQIDSLAFHPTSLGGRVDSLLEIGDLIEGRGACRHPDGVARFVRSAHAVFADDVASHLRHGPCHAAGAPPVLPVPSPRPARTPTERSG
jgi:NADH:ubiquinone oxidoreductase subunit F (NADH-binding)